jgi:hypothetical protein
MYFVALLNQCPYKIHSEVIDVPGGIKNNGHSHFQIGFGHLFTNGVPKHFSAKFGLSKNFYVQ